MRDHFERLSNFRDIGGVATADGRVVKTGVVFRSDEPSRITRRDLAKLEALGVKLICDLRAPLESQKRQSRILRASSIEIVNVPLREDNDSRLRLLGFLVGKTGGDRYRDFSTRMYHHVAFEQTARVREVITLLATHELPAVIHCSAGKDRTGFIAALLLLMVGVPLQLVMADYLRTNEYFAPRMERFIRAVRVATLFRISEERMRLVMMAHPEFLAEVHDKIVGAHGSVGGYLRDACAIDQTTLQRLEDRLLTSWNA